MTPTPRTQARAFAIWRYANPRDWNVTYGEIAEATGLTRNQIQTVIGEMGWGGRVWAYKELRKKLAKWGQNDACRTDQNPRDLTQIFSNPRLTSAQEFGIDWG